MRSFKSRRPGAILLIVLVLLALFAVVGLSFVLFAQSEAQSARIQRDVQNNAGDAPDPVAPVNDLLRQLIYGNTDSGLAVTSAIRGHELARTIYGYNPSAPNNIAYGGLGMFSENIPGLGNRRSVLNWSVLNSNDQTGHPEFTNPAAVTGTNLFSGAAPTGVYVGKNAPYTYPDINNAFLAMQDPATGRVTVPSFHRPNLFGTLASSNPKWTSAAGRAEILRPRPGDHMYDSGDGRGSVSDFPFPPMNPDGTYTGDVQNMRWLDGVQFNDALWMHMNLPPVKHRGRDVQPLVAMTILPLDGRVNLNAVGNHRDSGNGHASNQGFSPAEINPQAILVPVNATSPSTPPNEGQTVVYYRYGSTYRPANAPGATGFTNMWFDPSIQNSAFPDYSPVNFDAFNAPYPLPSLPNGVRSEPFYTANAGYDNNLTSNRHQSLYNPYFLIDTPNNAGRTLRFFDLRQTAYRYSDRKVRYAPPLFGFTLADNSFTGSAPKHPSNKAKANASTIGNSLNRSFLMPNFANPANMQFPMPGVSASGAPSIGSAVPPPTFTVSGNPAANSDMINGYRSAAAALGPVDLNRPIADYRTNKAVPLTNAANLGTMAAQAVTANRDRQIFAKDIFDRLVVATGAPCDGFNTVTRRPTGFTTVLPGTPGFHALRYLAQLSANIVDFVDIDDVNTAFVWNPANAANPVPEQDPLNFQPADVGNRTVFGVEKTRVVLNEAYGEVTNNSSDATNQSASADFEVRFFIELLNPLNANKNHTGPNATNTSPKGDGSAELVNSGTSVYRIQIFDDGNQLRNQLFQPGSEQNVLGTPTGGLNPRCQATMPSTAQPIEPNDNNNANNGFRLVVPQSSVSHNPADNKVYIPQPPTAPAQLIQIPAGPNALTYTVPRRKPANGPPIPPPSKDDIRTYVETQLNQAENVGKHAVALQRLANPYLPVSPTNPYITIDTMFDVYVNDAVRVGEQILPAIGMNPAVPGIREANWPVRDGAGGNEFRSHARRAPHYGYRGGSATASYAVNRQRTPCSHNSVNNTTFPQFEWLTHHDRKLISPLEILQVAGCKPHELLHYFCTSQTGQTDVTVQPAQKHNHYAPWTVPTSGLARGLEMLTVKPWMYGIPLGGRVPGRINVNAIWHRDVLTALLDQRSGTGNAFNQTDVNNLWTALFSTNTPESRTKNFPTPGGTIDDGNAAGDRPIKSFGVANFSPGGSFPNSVTTNESFFRYDSANTKPVFYRDITAAQHPMVQAEMLRKANNNLTTVSDSFVVIFTIGYFEIRAVGGQAGAPPSLLTGAPVLGREIFNEIPGDLRVQYAGIIDRTMLAVSPDPALANQQAPNVFFTELESNFDSSTDTQIRIRCAQNPAGSLLVNYEGKSVLVKPTPATGTLNANETSVIVIGTGSEAVWLRIPAGATIAATGTNGVGVITFPSTPTPLIPFTNTPATVRRKYYAGEAVGSAILGNPGPQSGFDPNAPAYKQVVRDLIKLTP